MGREGATAVLQKQSKKLAFSLESANTLKYVVIHGDNWTKETDREVFDVVGSLFLQFDGTDAATRKQKHESA